MKIFVIKYKHHDGLKTVEYFIMAGSMERAVRKFVETDEHIVKDNIISVECMPWEIIQ